MKRPLLPVVVLFFLTGLAEAQYRATHGLSPSDYQRWVDRAIADGYRVNYTSVSSGGTPRYAAVAVKDGTKVGWLARTNLTSDEYTRLTAEQAKKNFRPICVSGYLDGTATRFACIWVHDGRAVTWQSRHGMTARDYAKEFDTQKARGLRPDCISVHADGEGVPRFAAIFVEAGKTAWIGRHGLTGAEYQKVFDEWTPLGYRPITVSAYSTAEGVHFAIVMVKGGPEWTARHNLSSAGYQTEFEAQAKKGLRPISVVGYTRGAGASIDTFDQAMTSYMKERSIPTGTITVSRGGRVLLSKGYGFADRARTRAVLPSDPFRIASLSKPITAAAVRNLIASGKISLDTKAFEYLGLTPPAGKKADPRLKDVTVRHLLEHKGGWDRDASGDPMFKPLDIATSLGKSGPATANDVIRYMLGQPLDFAPGAKYAYSNFGYCVLGRIIEKATGQKYVAHIQKDLLAPLKITGIELGRSLPAFRNKREPFYADPSRGRNVMQPLSKVLVPGADGTFHLEAMDAHGGLIASSEDMIRFLDAYWISGHPRKRETYHYNHLGSLPGTFTLMLQHPTGLNVAAVFNQRTDASKKKYDEIIDVMSKACERVAATDLQYAAIWAKE